MLCLPLNIYNKRKNVIKLVGYGQCDFLGQKMRIIPVAFKEGELIPPKYTSEGKNVSPPFLVEDIPKRTKFLRLVCRDPDAPGKTWIHWDITFKKTNKIDENFEAVKKNLIVKKGRNSWNNRFYQGPKPPEGEVHRYYFVLYAIDARGSICDKAETFGVFGRRKGSTLSFLLSVARLILNEEG